VRPPYLRHARPLLGVHAPLHACVPRFLPCAFPPRRSRPPTSASLILPPPLRAPFFIRSCLSFICVCPYFIRACPTPRPYAHLWQPFAPSIELCALQPVQYNRSLHPAIQCGSDVAAIVDKVTPVLPYQRSTWRWPLSDGQEPYRMWWTDGCVCPSIAVAILSSIHTLQNLTTNPLCWDLCRDLRFAKTFVAKRDPMQPRHPFIVFFFL
jgi:hypothetical protein